MNPFGILGAITAGLELVGHAFGPKRREESRRERIWFGVIYMALMLAGIAAIVLTVWKLYFRR